MSLFRRAFRVAALATVMLLVVNGTVIAASGTRASASGNPTGVQRTPTSIALRSGTVGDSPSLDLRNETGGVPTKLDPDPAHWVHAPHPKTADVISGAQSSNWSGEVDTGAEFTGVQGVWVVPKVQPSVSPEYSATWVGIDGANNTSLIQTGTEQDSGSGTATYSAWYEILPAAAVPIRLSVSAGDQMEASVTEQSPGTWEIIIKDLTANWSASGNFAYHGPGTSAEWIEEAPTVDNAQSTLADFGSVDFSNATSSPDSGSNVMTPVSMVNTNGVVIAEPGTFDTSTDSFAITFGASPPAPPSLTSFHITTVSLPNGTLRTRYSTSLAARSGNPPYKWSVVTGTLPKGLHLKKGTGAIYGNPRASGTFTFTVKVVDKKQKTKDHLPTQNAATEVLSITIL